MKQSYLALIFLTVLGLCSCRKDGNDVDIKQYDQNQIDAYIKANNLTGMQRDKAGNVDTTGIYYQIINQGKGEALDYDKRISLVYTLKSLDGKYAVTDTFVNRSYTYLGAVAPKGLMLALYNLAKTKGTQARFLVPSHLAYGVNGVGIGSARLLGNESLDYYVSVLDDVDKYDDISINKYLTANNLTGYDPIKSVKSPVGGSPSIIYRKITQAGTGTVQATQNSTVNVQYTLFLLNGVIVDQFNDQESGNVGTPIGLESGSIQGWKEGLVGVVAGSKVSLILPSRLGYGLPVQTTTDATTGATVTKIPATSCLRFEINVLTVTN
jgi:FKBP-type peptidyl-prolyl cis-trans isomerase FkpA